MAITFHERERQWLFAMVMERFQNDYWRSLNFALLQSLLSKLQSTVVSFTQQENRYLQDYIQDQAWLYVGRSDPRLQHIIQGTAGRGSGVGAAQQVPGVGTSGGGHDSYFQGGAMYKRCKDILGKLGADLNFVGS